MFDIGTQELIIIFVVALLVFGPRRLPELARTLGKGVRDLKAAMLGAKETLEEETGFSGDVAESLKKSLMETGQSYESPKAEAAREEDALKETGDDKRDGTKTDSNG
jgi:sec-independent protein translocase protein TatB